MRDFVREHLAVSEARIVRPPGHAEILNDICLFAHFDVGDRVDPYVLSYLRALHDAGFSIVFVTACAISAEDEKRVREFCCDVIRRANSGLDFGSWSDAFQLYRNRFKGRLLLANDSVYGPMGNLKEILSRLTAEKSDFYGLVECNKIALHLQSWFLLFEPHVIASNTFHDILSQDFGKMSKIDVVRNGEVGLTQKLQAAGFHHRAMVTFSNGHPLGRIAFNPMHVLWREMLEKERVPFVKVEVLRDRLSRRQRETAIQYFFPEWKLMINKHIKRMILKPISSTGNEEKKPFLHNFKLLIYLASTRLIYTLFHYNMRLAANLLSLVLRWLHHFMRGGGSVRCKRIFIRRNEFKIF